MKKRVVGISFLLVFFGVITGAQVSIIPFEKVWDSFPKPIRVLETVKAIGLRQDELIIKAFQHWIKKQEKTALKETYRDSGDFPLYITVVNNNKAVAEILIRAGADSDQKNKWGFTCLITASQKGYVEMVNYLLRKGAEVNYVDKNGWSALMIASLNGYKEIAQALIKAGAWVNQVTTDTQGTALTIAAEAGHADIVDLLLKRKALVNYANEFGVTALMCAAVKGHKEVVKLLLNAGADVHKVTNDLGGTALMFASNHGHEALVDLLLKAGADVNCVDKNGLTPLMVAAESNHQKTIKKLLELGAEIDHVDNIHTTALIRGCAKKSQDAVRLLLEVGADMDLIDDKNGKALDYLIHDKNDELIDLVAAATRRKMRAFQYALLCEKQAKKVCDVKEDGQTEDESDDDYASRCMICLEGYTSAPVVIHSALTSNRASIADRHEVCIDCARNLIPGAGIGSFKCPKCQRIINEAAIKKVIDWYDEFGDLVRKEVELLCPPLSESSEEEPYLEDGKAACPKVIKLIP